MSEASAHKLSYVAESTIGTTPTNPKWKRLPDTRTTIALLKDTLTTERLTGNRFPAQPRTGARSVGGDIPADLSFGAYDDFIASALQGVFVDASVGEDTVDLTVDSTPALASAVGDTFTTPAGTVTIDSIDAVTQEVKFIFYTPALGGSYENYTLSGIDTITIDTHTFESTAYTDFQENATCSAGDTRQSFSILREFGDIDPDDDATTRPFLVYSGCEVASMNISASANALAKATFTFFGIDMSAPLETVPTGSSYSDAITTTAFDTFSGSLEIDGVAKCIITDYSLTINNGHAAKYTVGCQSSGDAMVGDSVIDGSLTAYFENMDLYNKFINEESMTLKLTLSDSLDNQLIFYTPLLRILSGTQPDVSGPGSITIALSFSAHEHETLGTHITVQRIEGV